METKHKINKLEENLILILLDTFKKYGWQINELPKIYNSSKIEFDINLNKQENLDIDSFLGKYRQNNEDWCNEGEIVLFTKNIEAVAKFFYEYDNQPLRHPKTGELIKRENGELTRKSDLLHFRVQGQNPDYGISLKDSIDYLTAIVLIHELTHWLIHWGTDFNNNTLKCNFKYDNNTINFHEGIAQYFTNYVLKSSDNQKICDIFNFLTPKQSVPYNVFKFLDKDLDNNDIDLNCIFCALGICWKENFKQDFEFLKNNNFLATLYYPEDYMLTYEAIKNNEPAINQEKIFNWFINSLNDFFKEFLSKETIEKKRVQIISKKSYGL